MNHRNRELIDRLNPKRYRSLADDKILAFNTNGELRLIKPTPDAYRELARHRISESVTRALPALANGRFYVRDVAGHVSAWTIPRLPR